MHRGYSIIRAVGGLGTSRRRLPASSAGAPARLDARQPPRGLRPTVAGQRRAPADWPIAEPLERDGSGDHPDAQDPCARFIGNLCRSAGGGATGRASALVLRSNLPVMVRFERCSLRLWAPRMREMGLQPVGCVAFPAVVLRFDLAINVAPPHPFRLTFVGAKKGRFSPNIPDLQAEPFNKAPKRK